MSGRRATRAILLVEDDAGLRNLYRTALAEAGFTVMAVADGLDALRVLEQRVPAAVVLDLALPRLSGRDVGQELKSSAHTRHIPIIVVTGTDAGEAEDLEIDCLLRKPILPDQLVEAVARSTRNAPAV